MNLGNGELLIVLFGNIAIITVIVLTIRRIILGPRSRRP